jgi:hypothetical protein
MLTIKYSYMCTFLKQIPHDIRERVRNFYRIQFAEGKMYDETELLHVLPPNLRHDILSFNQRHLFMQVPYYKHNRSYTYAYIHAKRAFNAI